MRPSSSYNFYFLSVHGYDIDDTTEVSVDINGTNYGNLKQGANNTLNLGDFIAIDSSDINLGINTITFTNNSGDDYGITNINLRTSNVPPPPIINLDTGEPHNGSYGENFGTNQHPNRLIATFDNVGRDIEFHVQGFNILGSNQTQLFLNDVYVGSLSAGVLGGFSSVDTYVFDKKVLLEGQNTVEFINLSGDWGIANIEVEDVPIVLVPILDLIINDD